MENCPKLKKNKAQWYSNTLVSLFAYSFKNMLFACLYIICVIFHICILHSDKRFKIELILNTDSYLKITIIILFEVGRMYILHRKK